jgi:hypothetical protein
MTIYVGCCKVLRYNEFKDTPRCVCLGMILLSFPYRPGSLILLWVEKFPCKKYIEKCLLNKSIEPSNSHGMILPEKISPLKLTVQY